MVNSKLIKKSGFSIILLLLYLASVMVWVGLLFVTSEGLWAPWDVAPVRPPEGHWQAQLGRFFEAGPGAYLPAVIFSSVQVALLLFTVGIKRCGVRLTSSVYFALNAIALLGLLVIGVLFGNAVQVPSYLTESDWRYYGDFIRELPYTVIIVSTLISLWVLPPYITNNIKKKPRFSYRTWEAN